MLKRELHERNETQADQTLLSFFVYKAMCQGGTHG